jgi:hypothetical protein
MTYQWRDLTGSVVGGKYTIGEYLGDVGDTAVFATDAADKPAIVRIAPIDRYATQWSTAETLSHPNLIRVYASGTFEVAEDAFDYIVSEKPDDSLSEVVQSRTLATDEAREVVKAILEASMYLHGQGLTHGAIRPDNVVAVGNSVKLSPWTISRAGAPSDDMVQTGETIIEILTQQRPTDASQARSLPQPFRRLAEGSLARSLTAAESLDVLNGREAPAPVTQRRRVPTVALVATLAALLLVVFWLRSSSSETASSPSTKATTTRPVFTPAPEPVAETKLPSPIDPTTRARAVDTRPPAPVAKNTPPIAKRADAPVVPSTPAPAASSAPAQEGRWAVVGAIYNSYQGAARRAESIAARAKAFRPEVFPPEGQGRRYMVILGYTDSRRDAEQLRAKAVSSGLPPDSYVTKVGQ